MKIIFVIGGARSGKSSFALKEASKAEGRKAYVATAEALDEEMQGRIEKHRAERSSEWATIEEPLKLPEVLMNIKDKYNAVLIDCLTLWLSNVLTGNRNPDSGTRQVEDSVQGFINKLLELRNGTLTTGSGARLFIVSNEVGTGIVPENKLARQFRDLAGSMNQKIAEIADEVYLVTAGIPLKIKDEE